MSFSLYFTLPILLSVFQTELGLACDRECTSVLINDTTCFTFHQTQVNVTTARSICADNCGLLYNPALLHTDVLQQLPGISINVTDIWAPETRSTWKWIDGTAVSHFSWGVNEPRDNSDDKTAVLLSMNSHYLWASRSYSSRHEWGHINKAVCQLPAESCTNTNSSETASHATNPQIEIESHCYKLIPKIGHYSSDLRCGSAPRQYCDNHGLTYPEAEKVCLQAGGDLAILDSKAKNAKLTDFLKQKALIDHNKFSGNYWIGAQKSHDCAVFSVEYENLSFITSCKLEHPFICSSERSVPPPVCRDDDSGTKLVCYQFSLSHHTYSQALQSQQFTNSQTIHTDPSVYQELLELHGIQQAWITSPYIRSWPDGAAVTEYFWGNQSWDRLPLTDTAVVLSSTDNFNWRLANTTSKYNWNTINKALCQFDSSGCNGANNQLQVKIIIEEKCYRFYAAGRPTVYDGNCTDGPHCQNHGMTLNDAKKKCLGLGGKLATIDSPQIKTLIQAEILKKFKKYPSLLAGNYWIGAELNGNISGKYGDLVLNSDMVDKKSGRLCLSVTINSSIEASECDRKLPTLAVNVTDAVPSTTQAVSISTSVSNELSTFVSEDGSRPSTRFSNTTASYIQSTTEISTSQSVALSNTVSTSALMKNTTVMNVGSHTTAAGHDTATTSADLQTTVETAHSTSRNPTTTIGQHITTTISASLASRQQERTTNQHATITRTVAHTPTTSALAGSIASTVQTNVASTQTTTILTTTDRSSTSAPLVMTANSSSISSMSKQLSTTSSYSSSQVTTQPDAILSSHSHSTSLHTTTAGEGDAAGRKKSGESSGTTQKPFPYEWMAVGIGSGIGIILLISLISYCVIKTKKRRSVKIREHSMKLSVHHQSYDSQSVETSSDELSRPFDLL